MYDKNNHMEEQDAFLKGFSEKLQNFEVPVDAECWSEIEARMQQKKRRIVPFWWWMSGGAAALLVLFLSLNVFRNYILNDSIGIALENSIKTETQTGVKVTSSSLSSGSSAIKSSHSKIKQSENSNSQPLISDVNYTGITTSDKIQIKNQTSIQDNQSDSTDTTKGGTKNTDSAIAMNITEGKSITETKQLPDKDWTDEMNLKTQKDEWYLAANAGTGSSITFSNNYSPLYSDAMMTKIVSAYTANTTIFTPDDFSEKQFYTPLSAGFMVGKSLNSNVGIETGVKYSLLYSSFSDTNIDANLTLHYLGIPVNLIIRLFNTGKLGYYVSGGCMIEKGLRSVYTQHQYWGNQIITTVAKTKIEGIQLSVSAAVGLKYNIAKNLQLYAQPEFSCFFKNNQPVSIRTTNPVVVSVNAGLKINL